MQVLNHQIQPPVGFVPPLTRCSPEDAAGGSLFAWSCVSTASSRLSSEADSLEAERSSLGAFDCGSWSGETIPGFAGVDVSGGGLGGSWRGGFL